MNICLSVMTEALCRRFFDGFSYDPDLFLDTAKLTEYVYTQEKADAHWQRQQNLGREHLAVMLDDEPIGEIVLKNIDSAAKYCTLGIHMKHDGVKNRGYGTRAEILALQYAFAQLGMNTVYADALIKNTRSRHVLEKAGFRETHRDECFVYYICEKSCWKPPEGGFSQF